MNYKNCLREFKKSLDGGSEFKLLISGLTKNISTNKIRWFDVGVGEGKYLKKIISRLNELGFEVEVSGADISKESIKAAKKRFPDGKFYSGDFSELKLEEKYDVISFNQTLYYFHNKNQTVEKCLNNLSEGGLLIGVLWSKKDKIFQFHQKIFGKWTIGAFCSEDLSILLKEYPKLNIVYNKLFRGEVNFKLWKESDSALKKDIHVISRIPLLDDVSNDQEDRASSLIKKQKDKGARINGVVIAKKSYEIPNFNRRYLNKILTKKFPSYKKLCGKIKGDNESLFMGSWEKETEYLSSQIKPGRILEICCASGLRSVVLGQRHEVTSIDINSDRIKNAEYNTNLFNVKKSVDFRVMDALNKKEIESLGNFDAIMIDTDWRENLEDPIKKQNLSPLKTTPRIEKLYRQLRVFHKNIPIIFKISPFSRVKEMEKLGPCVIEKLYIDGKFLSYNVYYSDEIKKSSWREIRLFDEKK